MRVEEGKKHKVLGVAALLDLFFYFKNSDRHHLGYDYFGRGEEEVYNNDNNGIDEETTSGFGRRVDSGSS